MTVIFACCGGGVTALAVTPQGEFGDLPNCGKASNRGVRPWLTPVLIAAKNHCHPQAAPPPDL